MIRRVELRPAAERDIDRFAEFLANFDPRTSIERTRWLRESLRKLANRPFIGRPGSRPDYRELTLRYRKSSYFVRYQVTDEAIVVVRIWHGRENRPR